MDYERLLFEKGCFLGDWNEDIIPQRKETPVERISKEKDLDTLLNELNEIKQHIEDVRQRKWELEKSLMYHNNGFVSD